MIELTWSLKPLGTPSLLVLHMLNDGPRPFWPLKNLAGSEQSDADCARAGWLTLDTLKQERAEMTKIVVVATEEVIKLDFILSCRCSDCS